jgi:hypothetical protein
MLKKARQGARFVLVTMPAAVVGWEMNKGLFGWIKSMAVRSFNPPCPQCDKGVLIKNSAGESPDGQLHAWQCNACQHQILAKDDVAEVREISRRMRNDQVRDALSTMDLAERETVSRSRRRASRIFYGMAALLFCTFVWMLATGTSLVIAANWASMSFMFAVFGLKQAYRSWQVLSGHVFQRGSFGYWFRNERWLV